MQRFLFAFASAATLAFSVAAPPAQATVSYVTVKNTSGSCAWITLYEAAHPLLPWKIVTSRYGRPRFLKPGSSDGFPINAPYPTDVKVRAEVKRDRDCSGHTIADVADYRKDVYAVQAHLSATLSSPQDRYTVAIH
jgi:hypothetical protein